MRAIRLSFLHMLKLMRHDRMLIAAGLAPLLAGAAIRYAVPFGEGLLVRYTGTAVLVPYYGLFDSFLACLTPAMFCFIAAMVMLEERDDHIAHYLFVTGLGRWGYFLSHVGIPALAAFVVTAVLLPVFGLTDRSLPRIALLSLAGTLQGVLIALLIFLVSSNKLEGMAVTKLSSLIILGAVVPWFVSAPISYWFSFLPAFWMGKGVLENSPWPLLLSAALAAFWDIFLLFFSGNAKD